MADRRMFPVHRLTLACLGGRTRRHWVLAAPIATAALLCACSASPSPSDDATMRAPTRSPSPSSASSAPATATESILPEGYVFHIQNEDGSTYRVELVELPSQGVVITHPWTISSDSAGLVEVTSTFLAELQVREVSCDAVASWEVEPGRYEVTIRNGDAVLEPSSILPSGEPLPTASTCLFSGP